MIKRLEWLGENLTKNDGIFKVCVPGNIQRDYALYKGFPNYQIGDNSKIYETVEDDTWAYYAKFDIEKNNYQKVLFRAKGIDYICEIIINGVSLLKHEGSFSRIDVDLTDHLKSANNTLCIKILPHPKREDAPFGRTQADNVCKAPVCYGWAWHPRLLVSGIWQDAFLEICDSGTIFDTRVTYTLSDDLKSANLLFDWKCKKPVIISIYDKNNNLIWQGSDKTIYLENVELWWCAGEGSQTMYRWVMESETDRREGKIGFRRSRLLMNEDDWNDPVNFPKSRSVAPTSYELNGRKIFLKGSNYITPDIFTGCVTKEHYRKQIELAVECNMNIFRCWGGCGCQKEEFYDLCDELGIMVWVEFPLACNNYRDNEHYLEVLESEATEILLRLREHPSIAFYCGGNELFNGWSKMTEQHLALRLLDKLCYEYDRNRPYIMTSPLFGMAHGNYLFIDMQTGKDSFELFRGANNTCYTEFGIPSIGNKKIIEEVIPKESQKFPIDNKDPKWSTKFGTANSPWKCQSDIISLFPECKTLDDLIYYSDLMQSMAYKAIFEESRRQWPKCTMALNWCYNEPWYTLYNRNIIDYDNNPRPSYYAVKDSLRPILATAGIPKFKWMGGEIFYADIFLHNDTGETIERDITVDIMIGDESINLLKWKGKCEPRSNTPAPTVKIKLPNNPNINVIRLSVSLNDGTVNEYTLRYCPAAHIPTVRRLND